MGSLRPELAASGLAALALAGLKQTCGVESRAIPQAETALILIAMACGRISNLSGANGAIGRLVPPSSASCATMPPNTGPSSNPCPQKPNACTRPDCARERPMTGISSGIIPSMPAQAFTSFAPASTGNRSSAVRAEKARRSTSSVTFPCPDPRSLGDRHDHDMPAWRLLERHRTTGKSDDRCDKRWQGRGVDHHQRAETERDFLLHRTRKPGAPGAAVLTSTGALCTEPSLQLTCHCSPFHSRSRTPAASRTTAPAASAARRNASTVQ